VRVSSPTLRNRAGLPLLLFHRLLVGRVETLQLVLTNEGALQSQVQLSYRNVNLLSNDAWSPVKGAQF